MAENRVYEVVFIVDPDTVDEDITRLSDNLQHIITEQGGTVTKTENMGRRHLAYKIGRKHEGIYMLFEMEGTGREIAELERRMRVNDQVLRYMTVRVDEDRRRADKLNARRVARTARRSGGSSSSAGSSSSSSSGGGGASSASAVGARGADEA